MIFTEYYIKIVISFQRVLLIKISKEYIFLARGQDEIA